MWYYFLKSISVLANFLHHYFYCPAAVALGHGKRIDVSFRTITIPTARQKSSRLLLHHATSSHSYCSRSQGCQWQSRYFSQTCFIAIRFYLLTPYKTSVRWECSVKCALGSYARLATTNPAREHEIFLSRAQLALYLCNEWTEFCLCCRPTLLLVVLQF